MSLPRIQGGLEKLEAQISESQAMIRRVEEFLRTSRSESNTKFEAMLQDQNAKFANLKTEISSMRNDVSTMRNDVTVKIASMEKRIAGLEESLGDLEKSLREA